jgi:hypothetical protein
MIAPECFMMIVAKVVPIITVVMTQRSAARGVRKAKTKTEAHAD